MVLASGFSLGVNAQNTFVGDKVIYTYANGDVHVQGGTEVNTPGFTRVSKFSVEINSADNTAILVYTSKQSKTISNQWRTISMTATGLKSKQTSTVSFGTSNNGTWVETRQSESVVSGDGVSALWIPSGKFSKTWKLNSEYYVENGTEYTKYYDYCSRAYSSELLVKGSEAIEYGITKDAKSISVVPNFYYYFDDSTEKLYSIVGYKDDINEQYIYSNCTDTYNASAISTTLMSNNPNVTSIIIPVTLHSIQSGSFVGTRISSFSLNGNSAYYVTDNDGKFLYTYGKKKLVAVAYGVTGTFNLPSTCTAVEANALALVSNVTLVSGDNAIPSVELGGTNNKVVQYLAPESLTYSQAVCPVANSNVVEVYQGALNYGLVVTSGQVLSAANIAKLLKEQDLVDKDHVCYVDFSSCYLSDASLGEITLPAGYNPNCLIYLPEGASATGTNVVVGTTCQSISVTSRYPFYNIKQFTANSATATGLGIASDKWSTICLPFGLNQVTINNGTSVDNIQNYLSYAVMHQFDQSTKQFVFRVKDEASAGNNPYLIKSSNGTIETLTSSQPVTVLSTVNVRLQKAIGTYGFCGTFQPVVGKYDGVRAFYGQSNGQFVKVVSNSIWFKSMGAYIYCPVENASENARIRFIKDDFSDYEENAETAIDEVSSEKDSFVNVTSNTIEISTFKNTYVNVSSVSGATIFSGYINGEKTIEVSKGIYLVNGKKYIVK